MTLFNTIGTCVKHLSPMARVHGRVVRRVSWSAGCLRRLPLPLFHRSPALALALISESAGMQSVRIGYRPAMHSVPPIVVQPCPPSGGRTPHTARAAVTSLRQRSISSAASRPKPGSHPSPILPTSQHSAVADQRPCCTPRVLILVDGLPGRSGGDKRRRSGPGGGRADGLRARSDGPNLDPDRPPGPGLFADCRRERSGTQMGRCRCRNSGRPMTPASTHAPPSLSFNPRLADTNRKRR